MKAKATIETIGTITKEELLSSVESYNLPNTCVLEATEPFVGYYGSHPEEVRPLYIFLIVKGKLTLDNLIRATQSIKKNFNVKFDASLAEINILNSSLQAIRLKDIGSYEDIRVIQEHYVFEGIKMKSYKKQLKDKALIKIEKSFLLEEPEENVFWDSLEKEMSYFRIPRYYNWKLFEEYTKKVKNNWSGSGFDAAQASFIRVEGIVDAVRIYTADRSIDNLMRIRDTYLKIMTI